MRHKRAVAIIDRALGHYVAAMKGRGLDPAGVQARTLAAIAKVGRDEMSLMLQQYRSVQGPGVTRYIIACEGYGRNGRWKIMSKPGGHQRTVQKNRREHTKFLVQDMAARITADIMYEIDPALDAAAVLSDAEVAAVTKLVESNVSAIVAFVEARLP